MKKNKTALLQYLLYTLCHITLFAFLLSGQCFADTISPTVSLLSPADGKKIYSTGDASYPIKVVFSAWDKVDGIRTAGAGSFTLFWWQGASSGSIDITSSLSSWGPTDTAKEVFRSYDWVPSAGSGMYTIQIQATDNATNTGRSRKVSVQIAITALNGYNEFPGDGKLLIRDNDNTICMSCHELKSHSSANIDSTKYGNWERVCRDCHTPHNTPNIFLLQTSFKIYTGVNNSYGYSRKVDFRNISGESTNGFVTKTGNARRGPCEVCHTKTRNTDGSPRWRNYTSTPDVDNLKHNGGKACINCHYHKDGFRPGESKGNFPCSGCHADLFNPMNKTRNGYHHFMNNADVFPLASGSKYPVINPPSPLGGQSDPNRRCLQCHLDHNLFKPELNPDSPSRAHNLRPNIATEPTSTSGQNTDFVESDPYGGICLSCHHNSQTKSYVQPDGTVVTPVINKSMFIDSPHNFKAPVTFDSGATVFDANCSKCHIDTLNKTKQSVGNQAGPHFSQVRRINAVGINENNLGKPTGSSSTTLTDSTKNWAADIWIGWPVTILEGAGAGQIRTVTGNDATTLTISVPFSSLPTTNSTYILSVSRGIESNLSTGGNTDTTLVDTNANWITNYWKDRPVTITEGTGYSQTSRVYSNTATTLTLYSSYRWSVIPDTTSRYSLGDPSEEEVCFRCHSRTRNPNGGAGKDYFGVKRFDNSKALKMEQLFNDPTKPYKHRIDRHFAKHRGDEAETAPVNATATGWFNDVSGGTHSGCQDCHNPHANRHPGDESGIAEGGDNLSLTDNDKNWAQDQWRGYVLRLMDGTGRGQDRLIVGNDATTLILAAKYVTAPASDTYYVIQPYGQPDKGNNLWFPNNGTWGVTLNYTTTPINYYNNPVFTKNKYLEGGVNKIYELCLRCHSDYAWGTSGSPFTIPDSIIKGNGTKGEGATTNIAREFNPNNLGYHPVIGIGANQPITPTGFEMEQISGPHYATGTGTNQTLPFPNTWSPRKYTGECIEITSGTGAGQIKTITSHDSTGINAVDPSFSSPFPAAGSEFYIRKCSSFSTALWPRFTGGTIDFVNGSNTVTISGLTNGIPSTVIKGWYLYAGPLVGSPPGPPTLASSGWFQVTGIGPGASDAGMTTVTLTVSPTPTVGYSGSYALSAGLGNSFVPPYGPWSTMGCADCHDSDDPRDPSGPHASSRNWMMRTLESQIFPWYYGGLAAEGSAGTTDATEVKMVGFPDGGDSTNDYNGWKNAWAYRYICYNCHRPDVYRTNGSYFPSGSSFVGFTTWRNLGRVLHPPHGTAASQGGNIYGIFCLNCHGGDNRNDKTSTDYGASLGGLHGSNIGQGPGYSFRGRRLLNGSVWRGITRASTYARLRCYYGGSNISSCNGTGTEKGSKANYAYQSTYDVYLPVLSGAIASDTSGGNTGVQNGDQVVLSFTGETEAPLITSPAIDTILALSNSHSWGSIVSAVWSTTTYGNDTLTITLDSDATIEVGDTITSDGTIKSTVNSRITDTVTVEGDLGHWINKAVASDASGGGVGIQAGDKVVISFNGPTAGTLIDNSNINSALNLGGHTWLDVSGNLGGTGQGVWTSDVYTNDTLTITLSTTSGAPTVDIGDPITLDGTIRDDLNNPITNGGMLITGTFDSIVSGAVGRWRFNNTSGITAYDDTAYANHGTLMGNTSWATGRWDNAIYVDGSMDYVEVPDSSSLDITDAVTMEAWIKLDAYGKKPWNLVAGKTDGGSIRNYAMLIRNTGDVLLSYDNGSVYSFYPTGQGFTLGAWHHVVGVIDTVNDYRAIYIDGELNVSDTSVIPPMVPNDYSLFIGDHPSVNWSSQGRIDEVVIYNRVLTPEEIRLRYSKIKSAVAFDSFASGEGVQAGDQVVITFNMETAGTTINASNIESALALSPGYTWGTFNSALWSQTTYPNDTLTITLNSDATVAVGDLITLDGTLKDTSGETIVSAMQLSGSFGAMAGMPDGLVGYWNLDEGAGTVAADSTFYNNTATAIGGPLWVSGRFGNAMEMVPNGDYIIIPDKPQLHLTKEFSLEFWMKKKANNGNQVYFYDGNIEIRDAAGSGAIAFFWAGTLLQSDALSIDAWHHIVATCDGITKNLYIDGVLSRTSNVSLTADIITDPLYVGIKPGTSWYLNAAMDDLALYNRALSAAEVTARYGANLEKAIASDPLGSGQGIQAGDQVVVSFIGETNGDSITALNINDALNLGGHTWLDGSGNIGSALWSQTTDPNDTLTITLSATSGAPTVAPGDTITLNGTIKDSSVRPIVGNVAISGTFNVITSSAVAYWNLEEGSGLIAYDSSGNGNHGTLVGSWWNPGNNGEGTGFYNPTRYTYIDVPDSDSLDLTSQGSIEFWAYKTGNRNYQTFIRKGTNYRVFEYGSQGRTAVTWANYSTLISDTVLPANIWHHYVVTYDGAYLTLYIDGEVDIQVPFTTDGVADTSDLYIGTITPSSAYTFIGGMDEVYIYNKALTAAEVKAQYRARPKTAIANDTSTLGAGIQTGDELVIKFSSGTNGDAITFANLSTLLELNSGSWGTFNSAVWSDDPTISGINDTLTITLNADATLGMGDTITIKGGITDSSGIPIYGKVPITGSFGAISGMPDGVIAHWKLDEGAGNQAADESTHGNNGIVYNALWTTEGRYNNGLSFDGSGDYVLVPDDNSLDLVDKGSIEFWMKKNSNKNYQKYIAKENGNSASPTPGTYEVLDSGTSGRISFYWEGGSVTTADPVPIRIWNHIVATYDGAALKIYVNGQLSNTQPYVAERLTTITSPLYLARGNGGYYIDGMLDDVAIYNRALSAAEIEQRFKVTIASITGVDETYGGLGVQPGDKAVIQFNGPTNGDLISAANIETALALDNSHSWLDGSGAIAYANWSSYRYANDTLIVGLSAGNSQIPTVAAGDRVTLDGTIQDALLRPVNESGLIEGDFDVPGGAIGVWWYDTGSGTTAFDATPIGNDGTLTGATWTLGRFGNGLSYNGTTDYVTHPADTILTLPDSYSIEAWIKPTACNNDGPIVANNSDFLRYSIGLDSTCRISYSYNSSGLIVGRNIAYSTGTVPLNKWTHIAVIRNGGSGSTATFYINGQPSGTFTDDHYSSGSGVLVTGKTTFDFDYFYAGVIDDLVIYNKALTADELKRRYGTWATHAAANNNSGGGHGVQAGDQVVINFDGETAGTAIDALNIDAALALNNSHSWLDGSGNIGGAVWSTTTYPNDTLTITLSDTTSSPNITTGDVITMGDVIKDNLIRSLPGSIVLTGAFVPLPAGAVAYYELDEVSGTFIVDATSRDNDGAIYGNATRTTGRVGNGISFDGVDDYVEITNTDFNLSNAVSVEFWMKAPVPVPLSGDAMMAAEAFVVKAWDGEFNAGVTTDTGWQGSGWVAGGNSTNPYSNTWHHIVLTWDGSTQRLYVDSVLDPDTHAGTGTVLVNQNTLRFGNQLTGDFWFAGVIDEVVIYNKALNQVEVTDRFNNP